MKMIDIQGRRFSKVICGSNPFYGHSHFSEARNKEYLDRFNDIYIRDIIGKCLSKGINTVESCANERIWEIISSFKSDNEIRFIGTSRIDETSPIKSHQQKIQFLIEIKADVCVIHAQFTDRQRKTEDIKGLKELIDKIHAHNLLAGISTHMISTVEQSEKLKYGVDLYLFPLNLAGIVYPGYKGNESVEERIKLIQQTQKPFIIMKSLASGRIPPQEGLPFVLDNIKENDLITLGFGSIDEAEESIDIIENHNEKKLKQTASCNLAQQDT